jgi:hypothetical protein
MTELRTALDPDVRELAVSRSLGVLTTLMADGSPQSSVVWARADERHILVGTYTGRQKYRNVRADPRVTIVLLTDDGGHRGTRPGRRLRDGRGGARAGPHPVHPGRAAQVRLGEGDRVLLRVAPDHIHRRL